VYVNYTNSTVTPQHVSLSRDLGTNTLVQSAHAYQQQPNRPLISAITAHWSGLSEPREANYKSIASATHAISVTGMSPSQHGSVIRVSLRSCKRET